MNKEYGKLLKPIKIIVIVIIIGFLVIALNGFLANNLTPHPVEIDRSGLHSSDYPLLSKIQFADYDELVRQCGLYNDGNRYNSSYHRSSNSK